MQTEIFTNQMTIKTVRKISYCKAINFKEIEPTLKKFNKVKRTLNSSYTTLMFDLKLKEYFFIETFYIFVLR